jgi:hypothetical protein
MIGIATGIPGSGQALRSRTLAQQLVALGPCELCLLAEPDAIVIGTGVAQWTDRSGLGRHATQAAGASQPTYTAITSSYGYVAGTGTQGLIVPATGLAFLHSGAGMTAVAIFQQSGTVGNYVLGTQSVSGTNRGFSIARRASPTTRVSIGNGSAEIVLSDVSFGADGSYHKAILRYASGTDPDLIARSDGVQVATANETGAPSALDPPNGLGICWGGGSSFGTTSQIRAVVLYSAELSDTICQAIEALFTAQWGV